MSWKYADTDWWYIYKVSFIKDEDEEYIEKCDYGLIPADTYVEVMDKLQDYYGELNIISIQVKCLKEAYEPYLLDEDRFDALWEGRD